MSRQLIKKDIAELFGQASTSGQTVTAWSEPVPETPRLDKSYVFPDWSIDVARFLVSRAAGSADNLWIAGPMGSGKTALIRRFAAATNAALFEVTGNERLELADLVGQYVLASPSPSAPPVMTWTDGPLTRAMREGGWLLINEADIVSPGVLAGLNTVLDGGCLTIAEHGSEVVCPADGFTVVVTANSNGTGDASGLYASIMRQNIALLDRFVTVRATYLPRQVEQSIIKQAVPSIPDKVLSTIMDVTEDIRKLFVSEQGLSVTMSVRTAIRWAQLCVMYKRETRKSPLVWSLDLALCNRADRGSAQSIHEILQRYIGETGGNVDDDN